MSTRTKQAQQANTYKLLATDMTQAMIIGQATKYHGEFEVGVQGDDGNMEFGSSSTCRLSWTVDGNTGNETLEATVQIGGVSSHSARFGRQRAACYLRACELAEALHDQVMSCGDPINSVMEIWAQVAYDEGIKHERSAEGNMVWTVERRQNGTK